MYFLSFLVAVDEIYYASTIEKFEISLHGEDHWCWYSEMGKQESAEQWQKFSDTKLQGF